ncbi:MAG TPA: ArdC-like ssDNA-binding domain-containing protein [Acidimicrobiales bacterium]|nr:ArdC-like ssDNA-binding domain-containing protein [Acidimicrobiales bacterium]
MTAKDNHAELIAKLTVGISNLTSSEHWKRQLELQSRFHRYSFSNVLLIGAQRPGASRVAGFHAWRRLNRFVRKGEKAIWIIAPVLYKRVDAEEGEADRTLRGFKFVPVFDVAQTEGEALPSVCNRLDGDGPRGLYDRLLPVARSIGFTVEQHEFANGANGDCCHRERRIRVESRNAPAQQVKTLAHELAHALLHESYDDRAVAELEAESTAYVVCQALGIDTGDYSFGYVATWAGGGEPAVAGIRASGERIQKSAASILRRIEPPLEDEEAA